MRIDVYHHYYQMDLGIKLDEALHLLRAIKRQEEQMSVELDALTVQVTENTDVENSAILLLQGLAAQIAAIKDDPVKLAALATSLKASATALAEAITANTPSA